MLKSALFTPKTRHTYIPVDLDVSPFDNSKTKKKGVERSYKGCDGYAPMFAYIGQEGHCLNVEMRKGSVHCQNGTPDFIRKTLQSAKKLTDKPLLFRLDSGNDSRDNIVIFLENETDFIIKRNPRKEKAEDWIEIAQKHGICCEERIMTMAHANSSIVKSRQNWISNACLPGSMKPTDLFSTLAFLHTICFV